MLQLKLVVVQLSLHINYKIIFKLILINIYLKILCILFNKANGRLHYDLEIIVKSNGESDFPLFGTKHAGVDAITYTGQNVKDQASADKAIQRQAEVDAANKAAANNNQ